jgi:DNA-binding NtrC family response regulator
MAIEHGLFLLDSQMEEIIDIVLEMHNEKPETCTEVIKNPSNNDQMKTAMQELHEWAVDKWSDPSRLISLYEVVNKIGEMLQKEKEQIVNAYKEGCSDSILDESTDEERAEGYYGETYTNPDRDENGRI